MQLPLLTFLAACSASGPVVDTTRPAFEGPMPADFSGSWERDYSRGDDIQGALNQVVMERNREIQMRQQAPSNARVGNVAGISRRELGNYIALARLVEEITRPDVLTISQDNYEIRVARKDDFSMSCTFHDGVAQGTESVYGTEVCGWEGKDLVSHLILPGLQITHRFTISPDSDHMRVITTATSAQTSKPIRLHRYYMRFDAPPSAFNCIETLSMKRVCSTAEIQP